MDFLLSGALAGGSMLFDLIDQISNKNSVEDVLDTYRNELKGLLVNDSEKSKLTNQLTRSTNTSIQNANNRIGIAGANKANQGTFSAAMLGPILAEQNKGLYDLEQNIFNYNKGIEHEIANVGLKEPGPINIGQSIATGLSGFQTGMAIDDYMNADEKFLKKMTSLNSLLGNKSDLTNNFNIMSGFIQ